MVCASRPAARLLRTAAPFELPGWYFGTTRPIIRLVVDLIIRVVLYYQPKADNPADNPAVSFVVYEEIAQEVESWTKQARAGPHMSIQCSSAHPAVDSCDRRHLTQP